MDDIQIIENALPPNLYSYIKNEMHRPEFPWNMTVGTASENDTDVSFSHTLYTSDSAYRSPAFPYLHSAFMDFTSGIQGRVTLLRVRAGLILPSAEPKIHAPHVDIEGNHWTALLYFTTEKDNGHTYFYKNRYNPYKYRNQFEQLQDEELEVQSTIASEENKLVIFKGDIYHSSSTPVNVPYRIAVNINFTIS